jgi:hypothetical protein
MLLPWALFHRFFFTFRLLDFYVSTWQNPEPVLINWALSNHEENQVVEFEKVDI